jgi:hypothetical protein
MKRMDNVRFGNDASYAGAIGQVEMEKAVIRKFKSRNAEIGQMFLFTFLRKYRALDSLLQRVET